MKKLLFSIFICCVAILFCFSSCSKEYTYEGKEDTYEGIEDTYEGIEIRMHNSNNGDDVLDILPIPLPGRISYAHLCITESNNFRVYEDGGDSPVVYVDYDGQTSVVCVGNVKNLGKIKDIPNSGWTNSDIAVKPGYGYIIKRQCQASWSLGPHSASIDTCCYARIYVVDWIEGTSGGILGATIRFQDNWK